LERRRIIRLSRWGRLIILGIKLFFIWYIFILRRIIGLGDCFPLREFILEILETFIAIFYLYFW
jgi:hypothetical protein